MSRIYTFAKGPFTPDMNDGSHIFVFGSNLAGRHGKGAALVAKHYWNALEREGYGYQGQSFAIATKDTALVTLLFVLIKYQVTSFLESAFTGIRRDYTFLITAIGCGLAGYEHEQIAPLFKDAPANCVLPAEWKGLL